MKKWAYADLKGKDLYKAMMSFDNKEGDKLNEYITMSRRPGVGAGWFEKYSSDVYPKDYVTVRGVRCRPPKFYDMKYILTNPDFMLKLRKGRTDTAKASPDNTFDRLKVRERVQRVTAAQLMKGR